MAKLVKVLGTFPASTNVATFPVKLPVYAGAASSIKAGMLVITDGSHAGYWKAAPDATDTDTFVNAAVAAGDSTETASANGVVEVIVAPRLMVEVLAKTPANLTAAMKGVAFILDVSGGDYTLDQATSTKGIFNILDFDNTTTGTCTCMLNTYWR